MNFAKNFAFFAVEKNFSPKIAKQESEPRNLQRKIRRAPDGRSFYFFVGCSVFIKNPRSGDTLHKAVAAAAAEFYMRRVRTVAATADTLGLLRCETCGICGEAVWLVETGG